MKLVVERPPSILVVEPEILVRHQLAKYLRDCGYRVVQASSTDEARSLFGRRRRIVIDVVLLDIAAPGEENSFALGRWLRENRPGVEVILTGSIEAATEKAADLCERGPPLSKPYDHQIVVDRIRRALAARERTETGQS